MAGGKTQPENEWTAWLMTWDHMAQEQEIKTTQEEVLASEKTEFVITLMGKKTIKWYQSVGSSEENEASHFKAAVALYVSLIFKRSQ